jgi:hypothetical protein
VAGFYTIRGLAETDDLIRRMKGGLVRDVSVGFHGGEMRCDLCGQGFWECRHFPGLKYEEKKGDTVTTQLATFTIDDARLSEVSGVFDGSTPEAMILKAQRAAKAGELTAGQVLLLENQYRTRLPVTKTIPVAKTKEEKMPIPEDFSKIRTLVGVETDEEVVPAVETLKQRVSQLEPQAEDGRTYRTDLVAQALAEGVRAMGNDFDKTVYETTLKSAPLSVVKRMRDDWKRVADANLPQGRQSQEQGQQPSSRKTTSKVPDAGYVV